MAKTYVLLAGTLLLLGTLLSWFINKTDTVGTTTDDLPLISKADRVSAPEIIVLCAASNQTVIELIRQEYEAEMGGRISLQFGSSQSLLAQLELSKRGDLYLPADDSYLALAVEKQLVKEVFPIATMSIGVAVKKGNPKRIFALADLLRDDVRVVQASSDSAAVGKVTRSILEKSGQWSALNTATIAFRSTVTEVAADVQISAADAGIVYAPVLTTFPELEFVAIPELNAAISQVSIGVTASSTNPHEAVKFARYITSPERGLKVYEAQGFSVSLENRTQTHSMKKDDKSNEAKAQER